MLFSTFELAAGSNPVVPDDVTYTVICDDGAGATAFAAGNFGGAEDHTGDGTGGALASLDPGTTYVVQMDISNCDPAANTAHILVLSVVGGGQTYEELQYGSDPTSGTSSSEVITMKNTNMNNNNTQEQDTMAAIGIGAMIVFIALILVAAVAAAVIIQTAEKLQQNAQSTGEDTTDEMSGKVQILNVFVNDGASRTKSTSALLRAVTTRPTPASCGRSPVTMARAPSSTSPVISAMPTGGVVIDLGDNAAADVDDVEAGTAYRFTLDATNDGGNDCSPDALFNNNVKATLYIHVVGGGTTYDILKVNDATEGAVVV